MADGDSKVPSWVWWVGGLVVYAGAILTARHFENRHKDFLGSEPNDDATPVESTTTKFKHLLRDDDPNAADVAQDYALTKGLKLSEISRIESQGSTQAGAFDIGPLNPADAPVTQVEWNINHTNPPWRLDRKKKSWSTGFSVRWNNEMVRVVPFFDDRVSREAAIRSAVADAWSITKQLKKLPPSATPEQVQRAINRGIQKSVAKQQPKELWG